MKKAFHYFIFAAGFIGYFIFLKKGSQFQATLSMIVAVLSMIFLFLSQRNKTRQSYRTKGAEHGIFNRLWTRHVHVDGPKDESLLIRALKYLARRGNISKINYVYSFIAGPQRLKFPAVYESHTPEIEGNEVLDFFSTTQVKSSYNMIFILNYFAKKLRKKLGTIIEAEQVVGMVTEKGYEMLPLDERDRNIDPKEVALAPRPSLAYEIHHGFDAPNTGGLPISLDELLAFCILNKIEIGGWFVFKKGETWAYRSNSFSDGEGLDEQVLREYELIKEFLSKKQIPCTLRTMIERVLGIWKIA